MAEMSQKDLEMTASVLAKVNGVIPTAGVVVEKGGRFLLPREGKGDGKEYLGFTGKLNLLMGRIEPGEQPYVCALREGEEEGGQPLHLFSYFPHRVYFLKNAILGRASFLLYVYRAGIDEDCSPEYRAEVSRKHQKVLESGELLKTEELTLQEVWEANSRGELFSPAVLKAIIDSSESEPWDGSFIQVSH